MFTLRRRSASRALIATLLLSSATCIVLARAESRPRRFDTGAYAHGWLSAFSTPSGYVVYSRPTVYSSGIPNGGSGYWIIDQYDPDLIVQVYGGTFDDYKDIPFRMQCEGTLDPEQPFEGAVAAYASTGDNDYVFVAPSLGDAQATVTRFANDSSSDAEPFESSVELDSSEGWDFALTVIVEATAQ